MAAFPKTLSGWLELLEARHGQTITLGLERIRQVRDALALQSTSVMLTVGGTNGKGSSCAMLEAILSAAGYRVGKYTSPHLLSYAERVRLNGESVDEALLAQAFEKVELARQDVPLSYFEHGTLAAWVCFAQAQLDVIIWEVGLGGRLDATNIFDADCALITSVDFDHMDYLGNTLEAIAFEKAGIFRSNTPAICAQPQPPATLLEHAQKLGCDLKVIGEDFGYLAQIDHREQWIFWSERGKKRRSGLAYPALRGAYQLQNASGVLAMLEAVQARLPVSMQAIRQGLMLVSLPGRFQVLPGQPSCILDVAHNPHAARALAHTLGGMAYAPQTYAVFGMLGDKDIESVVRILNPHITHWYLAGLPGPRALPTAVLHQRLSQAGIQTSILEYDDPQAALLAARTAAQKDDRIVIFGSFLTVAGAMPGLLDKV